MRAQPFLSFLLPNSPNHSDYRVELAAQVTGATLVSSPFSEIALCDPYAIPRSDNPGVGWIPLCLLAATQRPADCDQPAAGRDPNGP